MEARLAGAARGAKPGADDGDWASVDLDVNDDGRVDPADLAAFGSDDSPSEADLADGATTDGPAASN